MIHKQILIVIVYYANMRVHPSMKYLHLVAFLLLLENCVLKVETFEPLTTGALAVLGVSAIGSAVWKFTCKFRECCDDEWVHFNATGTSVFNLFSLF